MIVHASRRAYNALSAFIWSWLLSQLAEARMQLHCCRLSTILCHAQAMHVASLMKLLGCVYRGPCKHQSPHALLRNPSPNRAKFSGHGSPRVLNILNCSMTAQELMLTALCWPYINFKTAPYVAYVMLSNPVTTGHHKVPHAVQDESQCSLQLVMVAVSTRLRAAGGMIDAWPLSSTDSICQHKHVNIQ